MSQYPDSSQGPGPYVGPPTKKGMSTGLKVFLIIAGLSVLLCGGGFVACTALAGKAVTDVSNDQKAKASHVKLTTCKGESASGDIFPTVKFDVEVTNSSKNQNSYFIDVFIIDAKGTRVGNTTTMVTDVRPGQKATEQGIVPLSQKVSGKVTCKIDKVS